MAGERLFPEMPDNPLEHDKYIPETFNVVGKPVLRIDGVRKASGEAIFVRDVILPQMLYARHLRSPHGHAEIKSMDTSKAEALPGVRYILRYDDPIPEATTRVMRGGGGGARDNMDIVGRYAHWQGEPLGAVVVADTEEIAREAVKLIDVEWEVRPFILDTEEALKPGAPLTNPEFNPEDNICKGKVKEPGEIGDIEKGFNEADQEIEFDTSIHPTGVSQAESPSCIGKWEGDTIDFWKHNHNPGAQRSSFPGWFGVPINKVTSHTCYCGGSFGGSERTAPDYIQKYLSAVLSKRTHRPVKYMDTRMDDFQYHDHCLKTHYKIGFKNDGTITAIKTASVWDKGNKGGATYCIEASSVPNVYYEDIPVWVNTTPSTDIREGGARSHVHLAIVARVAAELGIDPTEVALKNDGCWGKTMAEMAGFKQEHGFDPNRDSLKECIEAGKAAIGWDEKWHAPGANSLGNGKMHGMGFGSTREWNDKTGSCTDIAVYMNADGTVNLVMEEGNFGVNIATTNCQIVAEELGMKYEDVYSWFPQDNSRFTGMHSGNSRGLVCEGYAAKKAAKRTKQALLEWATTPHLRSHWGTWPSQLPDEVPEPGFMIRPPAFPGYKPGDLDVKDSVIFVKADPSIKMTVKQAVKGSNNFPIAAFAGHLQSGPGIYHSFCRQAHFCEVEVDTETGEIEVKKVVNTNDVGKAVNVGNVKGQQYGGTHMGIGRGRTEELVFDPQTGVILNSNLEGYKWSTMLDIGEQESIPIETGLGYGPYGACGVGENLSSIESILAPAVYNAIGKWIDAYPITPDKVLKALGKI